MGGKVPTEMYYRFETDLFYDPEKIQSISLAARQISFVDINYKGMLNWQSGSTVPT